jgi:acyl-CoA thioesterase FadM
MSVGPTDEPAEARFGPPTDAQRRGSLEYRVRFDEATPTGGIRTSALLRYASDLAAFHSDRLGFGRAWYREHGLAWLVRGVDLRLLRPIAHGDELVGTTEAIAARKVLARRRTEFLDADGELAAVILVDWALTSASGAPTRIPPVFSVAFGMAVTTFTPVRARAAAPADVPVHRLELGVRPQELDPMDHVNNAVYLDWAEEALRAAEGQDDRTEGAASRLDAVPRRWELEYVRSAAPGDRALATSWSDGAVRCCRIEDADSGELLLGARLEA